MRLQKLMVRDFRNLQEVEFIPDEQVSVIYGDNGQGKTNLMEAVYLLTGQKSFRPARESDFLRFGCEAARISVEYYSQGRTQTAELTLGAKKSAALNGVACPPSGLTGEFLAVVFSPGELSLVQDGPAERRAFLDGAISQVMPRYLATMNTLSRVLLQRNTLLADLAKAGIPAELEALLETWDANFARAAYSIFHARSRFIARLLPAAAEIYREICGGVGQEFSLQYQPGIAPPEGSDWSGITPAEGEVLIRQTLLQNRSEDYKFACTTVGPQRDNMEVLLDGISARVYGSQGQQRSCALALKLSQCRVIEETLGESPIVLLDDVLSELDRTRRDYFLKGEHRCQLIITNCDRGIFRSVASGAAFRMRGGVLVPPRHASGKGR